MHPVCHQNKTLCLEDPPPFLQWSLVLQKIKEEDGKETLKFWIRSQHSQKRAVKYMHPGINWPRIIWKKARSWKCLTKNVQLTTSNIVQGHPMYPNQINKGSGKQLSDLLWLKHPFNIKNLIIKTLHLL